MPVRIHRRPHISGRGAEAVSLADKPKRISESERAYNAVTSKPSEGDRERAWELVMAFPQPQDKSIVDFAEWAIPKIEAAALKWAADTVEKFYIDGTPTSAMPELIDQIKAGPSSEGAEKEGE